MNFKSYEVGKLFKDGVTRYQEGIKIDITNEGLNLMIFFRKPTAKEIKNIKNGFFQCGFKKIDDIIFFLFRFATDNWMDAPYSAHLSNDFVLQELEENNKGYALHIYLIDADTGIIKAMRLIGLSNKFSKEIKKAVEEQKNKPFNVNAYDQRLNSIYMEYTTDELVKIADYID